MPDPVLWPLDDHTRAKHRVLRAYLDQWIPIMGQQALKVRGSGSASQPRLLLVDGFAGPGRYATGEPGSPLIMLEALTSHAALPEPFGHLPSRQSTGGVLRPTAHHRPSSHRRAG
jgi:hypothetical protein